MEIKILFDGREYCEFSSNGNGEWIDEDGDKPAFQSALKEIERGIRAEPWFMDFDKRKK